MIVGRSVYYNISPYSSCGD